MAAVRALVVPRTAGPEERARTTRGPLLGEWHYVDEARTHQVVARFTRATTGFGFHVRESPFGSATTAEDLVMDFILRDAWEARFHQAELEGRLAQCGAYWRREPPAPGWSRVRRNLALPRVDLRPLPMHGAAFHHFHDARSGGDRLVVTLPLQGTDRQRVADLRFRFPHTEAGDLRLLHAGLPPALLRSLLTREHLGMAAQGFEKLMTPADFAMAFGADWRAVSRAIFEEALGRVREGRLGLQEETPREAPADAVVTDYHVALRDPRLAAVHRRFLRPAEEEALLSAGVAPIRRAIGQKRRDAGHDAQHLLTVLEASLLARYAFRLKEPVDPEAARVLRRLDYYL